MADDDLTGPASSDNPFAGLPMFGDLAKALSGQGPLNWDAARQFAGLASNGGASEPNVDPAVRIALADLARIICLLYTSPSPRDRTRSRMPSSA